MNLTMPEVKGIPLQSTPAVGIPLVPPPPPSVVAPQPTEAPTTTSQEYSVEDIGARIRSKSPEKFAGFSDTQIGQRVLEKKPELQKLIKIKSSTPIAPQAQNPFDVVKQEGGIAGFAGKALDAGVTGMNAIAGAVNKGYDLFKQIPLVKSAGKVVGGVVGNLGGVIGSGIGTLGALTSGKPILETAEKTAEATKRFGQKIGEEGAYAAPLGAAGRVLNTGLAVSQIAGSADTAKQALKTGDITGLVEAGTQLGTGILAGHGAMSNKGVLLDKSFSEAAKEKLRGQTGSPYLDKAFAPEAEKIMAKRERVWNEAMNLGAGEAKKIQKAALRGQERNVGKLLAQEDGLTIEETPEKKISTTKAREEIRSRRDLVDKQLTAELQSDQRKWFSLNDAEEKAVKRIQESTGTLAAEKNSAIADIRNVFDQERKSVGIDKAAGKDHVLTGAEANDLKRGLYKYAYDEKGQPRQNSQHFQSAAEIIKSAIEDHYKDNANIREINKKLGDYIVMDKALYSIEGRTVRGGVLLRKLNQVIGGSIGGSIAGAPGAIAGVEMAGRMTDYLTNPERKIGGLKKLGTLTNQESLKKNLEVAKNKPIITEAKPLQLQSGAIRVAPIDRSGVASQAEAVARLKELGTVNKNAQPSVRSNSDIIDIQPKEYRMPLNERMAGLEFPDFEREQSYKVFKNIVQRNKTLLDLDAEGFRKKFANDPQKLRQLFSGAQDISDTDLIDMFIRRFDKEQMMKQKFQQEKQKPVITQNVQSDIEPF